MEKTVTLFRTFALSQAVSEPPAEIHVIPFGRHETDKGVFVLDEAGMAEIVAEFEGRKNDMVVDYEHQTLSGGEAPAAGWIKKLVAKGRDGLWAVVDWTPRAAEYLKNREYRYLSPVFLKNVKNNRVVRLLNAALTNQPAIDGMAPVVNKNLKFEISNLKSQEKEEAKMKKLLTMLGLSPEATEDEAVADMQTRMDEAMAMKAELATLQAAHKEIAVAVGLKEDASASELKGTVVAMKQGTAQAEGLSGKVADLERRLREKDAAELVGAAMKAGKVTPANEAWARDYASKDPEGFRAFVAKAPKVIDTTEHGGGGTPPRADGLDEVQKNVNKMLGVDAETFKKHNQTHP